MTSHLSEEEAISLAKQIAQWIIEPLAERSDCKTANRIALERLNRISLRTELGLHKEKNYA